MKNSSTLSSLCKGKKVKAGCTLGSTYGHITDVQLVMPLFLAKWLTAFPESNSTTGSCLSLE